MFPTLIYEDRMDYFPTYCKRHAGDTNPWVLMNDDGMVAGFKGDPTRHRRWRTAELARMFPKRYQNEVNLAWVPLHPISGTATGRIPSSKPDFQEVQRTPTIDNWLGAWLTSPPSLSPVDKPAQVDDFSNEEPSTIPDHILTGAAYAAATGRRFRVITIKDF